MKKYLLFSIIVLAAWWVLGSAQPTKAATINAASCSAANVQSAIDAAIDGDTVSIPSGSCTWTSPVAWSDKNINLIGAGKNSTIITFPPTGIVINNTTGKPFRISGMTFRVQASDNSILIKNYSNTSGVSGWRIDNIKFDVLPGGMVYCITIQGPNFGLVDNCNFVGNGNQFLGVVNHAYMEVSGEYPNNIGKNAWLIPLDLGGPSAVYVEDCTFDGTGSDNQAVNDVKQGGAMVIRHNTITHSFVQTHAARGATRGGKKLEVYNNTFVGTGFYRPLLIRSGTGVIFNNTISGYGDNDIHIDNERTCCGVYGPRCDGSSSLDENTTGQYGWPCEDQIGVASGDFQNQTQEPFYSWKNGTNASCATGGTCDNASTFIINPAVYTPGSMCEGATNYCIDGPTPPTTTTHIQSGRDYSNNGSTPKSGYVPYTYPHPLRGGVQPQTCGNNTREGTETCDGTDLAGQTCVSRGFSGGTLSCNSQCTGFVTTGCTSSQYFLPEQFVQAESGTLSGIQTGISGSDTYVYTNLDNTGSASFAFDIQNAGQYKMEARVNNNNDGGQNSFYVGLGNESAQGNDYYEYNIFPLAASFNWDDVNRWGNGLTGDPPVSEFDPMTWNLTTGLYTFTFYGREANTWLDQIILKRVTADTTPPAAPTGLAVI